MNQLTKTLTISAMTAALAGGFGFAQAQSASTGNGSTGNPDPNATLSAPVQPDSPADAGRTVDNMNNGASSTPGAFSGEAADSNTSYGGTRTEPGSVEMNHTPSDPPTRGESARSNNSYGHSRVTPQEEAR